MDQHIIVVKKLYKSFKLPHEKSSSLKQSVLSFSGKRYENFKALNNIEFEIKKGEFFGIVGRNGSGKSTLLKLLAGIYKPTKGTISISGRLTPFIELGVGFNPELTGRDNIYLNGAILGLNQKEIENIFDEIVEFAELEKFIDQRLKNYSSGMQVRLAFSIAIRAQSDILLIDEVLAVGDAVFQKKCFEYFNELKREGRTVVFVSHDTGTMLKYCDRGLFIDDGQQKYLGKIADVIDAYRSVLISDQEKLSQNESRSGKHKKEQKPVKVMSAVTKSANKAQKKFKYGEDITIDLTIKKNSSVSGPINIAMGIYFVNDYYTVYDYGVSTEMEKVLIPENATTFSVTITDPRLRNGFHAVHVSIFGETETIPYDYVEELVTFEVRGGPDTKSRGAVVAEHTWSIR